MQGEAHPDQEIFRRSAQCFLPPLIGFRFSFIQIRGPRSFVFKRTYHSHDSIAQRKKFSKGAGPRRGKSARHLDHHLKIRTSCFRKSP